MENCVQSTTAGLSVKQGIIVNGTIVWLAKVTWTENSAY